jgi:hypothetical protein
LDASLLASQKPVSGSHLSTAAVLPGGAGASGAGGGASGSGVGRQECNPDEISALQALDTQAPVDPVGKAINRPIGQCDNDLVHQRAALQVHTVPALAPDLAALNVPSVESSNAAKNTMAAKAVYDAALASQSALLSPSAQTNVQTAANTRLNSAAQNSHVPPSVRGHVSYFHPLSIPSPPQTRSQPPHANARQASVPANDGTGRYPETAHFSHYMDHYI